MPARGRAEDGHFAGGPSAEDFWEDPRGRGGAGPVEEGAGAAGCAAPGEAAGPRAAAPAPGRGGEAGGVDDDDDFGGWAAPRGEGGQRGAGGWTAAPGAGAGPDGVFSRGVDARDAPGFEDWAGGSRTPYDNAPPLPGKLPDITALSRGEAESILPRLGTGDQYKYYWGAWETGLQRVGLSLLVGLTTSDSSPWLSAAAFSFIFWGPVAQAALRNRSVQKFPFAGLWHARVLELRVLQRFPDELRESPNRARDTRPLDVLQCVVGDDSGAQVMLEAPVGPSNERIQVGDSAELAVVSDLRTLHRFQVVRDAFLPASKSWICDYPFLARVPFERLCWGISAESGR